MNERAFEILEILNREKKSSVSEISALLGVSQVTVRKDLSDLEERGIIRREHGYAQLANINDIGGRIAHRYEEKRSIAKRAAELVSDGDTIMVESGSCCTLLVEELTKTRHGLTIITNSCFIPDYVRGKTDFGFTVLGGMYQQDSQVMVGPLVKRCVSDFRVDLFFIGVDGYDPKDGFSNRDYQRAAAVTDMAGSADRVVVITTGEKLSGHSTVPMKLDNVRMVVTDGTADPEAVSALRASGITVDMV